MQKDNRNDEQLIIDYLDGDEESLKILVDKHLKSVYNFIYYMCNNIVNTEDITQEVFVKVWKNLKKYNSEKNFKTWLFTITRNTTIDWLRKKKDVVFSDFDTRDGDNFMENTTPDKGIGPDESAIFSEDKNKLRDKILRLSPIYQNILEMKYTEELTFKEIGEILQKPIDTVKSQHRRALIELKKLFS